MHGRNLVAYLKAMDRKIARNAHLKARLMGLPR